MAKRAGLTARSVATERKRGTHGDGGGLYLQISRGGARSWIYRFQLAGTRRFMGLGSADLVGLAEAREVAHAARRLVAAGRDPIDARQSERAAAQLEAAKAMSFRECAERYIAAHRAGWRNAKHAAQWPSTLEAYAFPIMGALPVQTVDVGLIMQVLEPMWTTRTETASRVRRRIESVLDWAAARGFRPATDNPARWRGHLENLLPAPRKVARVEHHAALPYAEASVFMVELRQRGGTAARALEFVILTAARAGEVLGARWSEIDMAKRLWTIPAERMKAGKEHRVPLSEAAFAIVKAMAAARSSEFVFGGGGAGRRLSHTALQQLLRRMRRSDVTTHGFRSTFRDWAAERTSYPAEVAEMALAHAVANAVEAAYRRGDMFQKRRQLADAWAKFINAPSVIAGQVVSIRAGRND
jgi:integrase